MDVKEVMIQNPACCEPNNSLLEVVHMMIAYDCGSIPVVEDLENRRLIGIITDRDIVCRSIGQDKNPLAMNVNDCFSSPVVTARPDTSVAKCARLMEENQVRRLPIVNNEGRCVGLLTEAEAVKRLNVKEAVHLIKDVSRKSPEPSRVPALR